VNTSNFVEDVAKEMALGRLNAVTQILANYKRLTGKEQLQRRAKTGRCAGLTATVGSTANWPLAADH
jgi:hypothetical protein